MAEQIKFEGSALADEYKEETAVETPIEQPTVVETPVVNAPVVETPSEQPTVTPFEERWKQEFGEVDVNTVKERFSQFDTVHKELEEIKTKPVYKTEAGKNIDEWLAKGVSLKTITKFGDVKAEELTPEQAIKLKLEIENPQWEQKHINAYYDSKYVHVADELKDDSFNEVNATLAEAALMKDGQEAKSHLAEYLSKQLNPSGVLDNSKKDEAVKQLSSTWYNNSNVLLSSAKEIKDKLSFKVAGEKGEEQVELPYSYVVPENDLQTLTQSAIDAAIQSGIQPTQEGLRQVQSYLNGLIWANHGTKILQVAVNDVLSKQTEAFQRIIHNPVVAGTGSQFAAPKLSMEEAFLQHEVSAAKRNR